MERAGSAVPACRCLSLCWAGSGNEWRREFGSLHESQWRRAAAAAAGGRMRRREWRQIGSQTRNISVRVCVMALVEWDGLVWPSLAGGGARGTPFFGGFGGGGELEWWIKWLDGRWVVDHLGGESKGRRTGIKFTPLAVSPIESQHEQRFGSTGRLAMRPAASSSRRQGSSRSSKSRSGNQ